MEGQVEAVAETRPPIFHEVHFAVIESSDFCNDEAQKIINILVENGATYRSRDSDTGRIPDLTNYTHIITNTIDFPEYDDALEHMISVVRPLWVTVSMSKRKTATPRPHSPDPRYFFSDVVVCSADLPYGDREAIVGGVMALGGQHSEPLSKLVTHIVALSLENERCQAAEQKKLKCKIVLPHWIDDCLKLGRRIPEGPYLFPNPDILQPSTNAIQTKPSKDIVGATSPTPTGPPTPLSSPRSSATVQISEFQGWNIMISNDLNLRQRLRDTLGDLITIGGGEVVNTVDEAHIYICQYRDGADYVNAIRERKTVGNLAWLYHLIARNEWIAPTRRLLHFPVPRHGIPGFEGTKISLSNYVGEARFYLQNLVKAAGGELTGTMRQDNTHLITAHMMSEKCDAARGWNINIVNHLWLEDSYAKGRMQNISNKRYTHFPPRTNLSDIVGQTQIDKAAIEDELPQEQRLEVRSSGEPVEDEDEPAASTPAIVVAAEPEDTIMVDASSTSVKKSTPLTDKLKRSRSDVPAKTPAAKHANADKENDVPRSTGGRSAKQSALSKLHGYKEDLALFDKESKRPGGVVYGGRRKTDPDRVLADKEKEEKPNEKATRGRKRKSDEAETEEVDAEDETEVKSSTRKGKKSRSSGLPPIEHRLMVSGEQRWTDVKQESADKTKLRELGIQLTEDPTNVSILCAPKILRTKKFVAAMACGPTIVSTSFIDACLSEGQVPDLEEHLLDDAEGEKRFDFSLSESTERALQNKHRLLKDWQIFCTDKVNGGFDTYKDIIVANGGDAYLWNGRQTTLKARKRAKHADEDVSQNQQDDEEDTLFLIGSGDKSEKPLWEKFKAMAESNGLRPMVVKVDWLLNIAMAQYVRSDPDWVLSEE